MAEETIDLVKDFRFEAAHWLPNVFRHWFESHLVFNPPVSTLRNWSG